MFGIPAKKPSGKRRQRGFSLVELVAGFALFTLVVLGFMQYTLVSHLNMALAASQQSMQDMLSDQLLQHYHLAPGTRLQIPLPEEYAACTPPDRAYVIVEKLPQPQNNLYQLRASVWWQWLPGDPERCQLLEMVLYVPE